jgi:hypothetical protein
VVPVGEVERAMRGLDRAALLAFVAEAWAARGRETAVVDGVVLAREPATGVERRVAVAPARSGVLGARLGRADRVDLPADADADAGVDAVVTPAPERVARRVDGDVRVLGPAAVRDLLRHGLDASTGERLARRHLDVSLRVPESAASTPGRPAWLVPAAVLVLILVGVAVAAGLGAPSGLGSSSGPGAEEAGSGVPSVTAADSRGDPTATPPSAPVAVETPIPTALYVESMPAGLGRAGVENVTRLAAGHRETVAGAPYALVVTVERTNARGTTAATARTSVRVRNRSVYRFDRSVTRRGDGTAVDLDEEGYADGEALYVRDGDGYRRTPPSPSDDEPYADAVSGLVTDVLGTGETSVRGYLYFGSTRYRVVASGTSPLGSAANANASVGASEGANVSAGASEGANASVGVSEGANASAIGGANATVDVAPGIRLPRSATVANRTTFATIRPSGLVRQLRIVSERPDGTEVTVEVRYVTVGYLPGERATVDPPEWYADAREATNGSSRLPGDS